MPHYDGASSSGVGNGYLEKPAAADKSGKTALHYSAQWGRTDTVPQLLVRVVNQGHQISLECRRRVIVAYLSEATPYSLSYTTHPPASYNTRQRFPPYVQQ